MRSIRNCNVAVVGGAGFLGSHVVNHLIDDRQCKVTVLDNLEAGRREFVHPDADFIYCDITGPEEYLLRIFRSQKIQYVLNYTAIPYVPYSFDRPLHVANVNFFGACKVINAAYEAGCAGILQVSSAEIYGDSLKVETTTAANQKYRTFEPLGGAIDEDHPVRPHSTYGASKAAVDFYVQSRWREAKVPAIALRQFNCLGERETHPYVVPEIISQLFRQAKMSLCPKCGGTCERFNDAGKIHYCPDCYHGEVVAPDATATVRLGNNAARDFLYAGDQARMAVELLEKGQWGEVFNLGSQSSVKVYDLAVTIAKLMGFQSCEVVPDQARVRPWEIWALAADSTKIHSVIDARPQVSLEDALKRTIADYVLSGRKWAWEK